MTARALARQWMLPAIFFLLSGVSSTWAADGDVGGEDGEARALNAIQRMADFLAATKQFEVTIDIGYDIVQAWGQKIEFGETRVLTVRRPDRLRVDTTDRTGAKSGVVFDGKQIAAFDFAENVYATVAKAGTLDQAIAYFVDDLGMRLPMGGVLSTRLAQNVAKWATDIAYVERSTIAGVACDHIALRGDWEDVQMWIAQGDRPLLQRMVITYKRAEGRPQFWAQLRDWNLSPKAPDSVFAFTPAKGAAQIAFVPRTDGPRLGGAPLKGGQP